MFQTVLDLFAHDENMHAGFRLLFFFSRISLLGKRQRVMEANLAPWIGVY